MTAPGTSPRLQILPLPPQVRPAAADDAALIADLLLRAAPETIPVPAERVRDAIDRYRVIREGGKVVATAALHPVGDDRLELRSVAVAEDHGGRGLGSLLVKGLQDETRKRGRRLLCVTLSPGFFARLGFRRTSMGAVPPKPERRRWPVDAPRVAMAWLPASENDERSAHVPATLRRIA